MTTTEFGEQRAYFFGNMYLSSIQQGIQAAHVLSNMFIKYQPIVTDDCEYVPSDELRMLNNWASEHKTMILLNGGYSETIRDLYMFFTNNENSYPFDYFTESGPALDGALTCTGIILPEKIYEAAAIIRGRDGSDKLESIKNTGSLTIENNGETVTYTFNKWEFQLIQKLNQFGLAS